MILRIYHRIGCRECGYYSWGNSADWGDRSSPLSIYDYDRLKQENKKDTLSCPKCQSHNVFDLTLPGGGVIGFDPSAGEEKSGWTKKFIGTCHACQYEWKGKKIFGYKVHMRLFFLNSTTCPKCQSKDIKILF